jgi:dihydropteroate synthase
MGSKRSFEERWPRPSVMGILNVTPDSFSDGGQFVDPSGAITYGRRLVQEGAALVDVGGESTRPGAEPVPAHEELERVEPVLAGLSGLPISIDTSKAVVARRALELGAALVNDVTALRGDPEMATVVADGDAFVCLMHMQGEPRTMQAAPHYDDVVSDVLAFLEQRVAFAVEHGIGEERICVDPGIGFGKTPDQNLELLRRLDELGSLGRPVVVGVSRKSTLGKVLGDARSTRGSLAAASLAGAVAAFERGAAMIRAHDVRETVDALAVAAAVERGKITA